MVAYAQAGEKALALRQYHACRSVLRRELGVEASPETRGLYQLILEDRPLTEAGVPSPPERTRARAVSGREGAVRSVFGEHTIVLAPR